MKVTKIINLELFNNYCISLETLYTYVGLLSKNVPLNATSKINLLIKIQSLGSLFSQFQQNSGIYISKSEMQ